MSNRSIGSGKCLLFSMNMFKRSINVLIETDLCYKILILGATEDFQKVFWLGHMTNSTKESKLSLGS